LGFYLIVASTDYSIKVNPPGGTYPDTILVSFLNMYLNEADRIYYTLDGTEPVENCLEYSQGDIIRIDKTTILKYVVYRQGVPGNVVSVTYQVLGGGDTGTTLTNEAMVKIQPQSHYV
jgi:hypothetical protein